MKNLARTIRILLSLLILGSLLLPFSVMAQASNECKSLTQTEEQLKSKGALCLTPEEKTNMIYTVIEEGMDTPDSPDNNAEARSCARYTETLICEVNGKSQKITNQGLFKECPDMPDSGTDAKHQSFDCQNVTVLLVNPAQGGVGVLQVYLGLIYRWAAGIVGIIAILIIIVSGIQISASNGEAEAMSAAKKRIFQSLGGLALLFLASGLLYMVDPNFFKQPDAIPSTPPGTSQPGQAGQVPGAPQGVQPKDKPIPGNAPEQQNA